jgi:hypothetical protein
MDQATSKFLKDKTSEEELLWVIQKDLPETTIIEWKKDGVSTRKPITYSSKGELQNNKDDKR